MTQMLPQHLGVPFDFLSLERASLAVREKKVLA